MKYHQLTRLFVADSLKANSIILSNAADIHYLIKVMRKRVNDQLLVFNASDGEYLAQITEVKSKAIIFELIEQVRGPEQVQRINLVFAPIKHTRMQFLLEKATELGVTKLIPIQTKHSVVDKINLDKWTIYVKEAAEQCLRLSMPEIMPMVSLEQFLKSWDKDKSIILCNEKEKSLHISKAEKTDEITAMIGPEGGFSEHELERLTQCKFITSVHLGARILRAETAALAALSIINY